MTGARPKRAARRMAISATTAIASSGCSWGASASWSRTRIARVSAYPTFGPGEPSSLPVGQPAGRSPGRFATQLLAAGIFTPGARFCSWRGSSSRRSGTNGSVGTDDSLAAQLGSKQPVHERVLERLPRRLDDVLPHPDRRPRLLAVGAVDEHPGHGAGALVRVEHAHLVVREVNPIELRVPGPDGLAQEIGRASCRERVWVSGVGGAWQV